MIASFLAPPALAASVMSAVSMCATSLNAGTTMVNFRHDAGTDGGLPG